MIKIRDLVDEDLPQLMNIYNGRKYSFQLPDPKHPLVIVKKGGFDVVTGKLVICGFARVLLNAFLLVDKMYATPIERLEAVELIEDVMIAEAQGKGLDEGLIQVDRRFGKRLEMMGWKPGEGCTYTRIF